MVAEKLIELVELHAARLAADVTEDVMTNPRTRGFRTLRRVDLEERLFRLFHQLGDWIGRRQPEKIQAEFAEWGGRRYEQHIPLSEVIYSMIILKQHLRRYIRDNGLVEASFPRVEQDYVLPMHLNSLQELNAQVGRFFDEALYHLATGYEERAAKEVARQQHRP
jgi:hypothetical protein